MLDNIKLLQDLQGALTSTLELNLNLESLRMNTFRKKVSEKSVEGIQCLSSQIESLQTTMEKYKFLKKKKLPLLNSSKYSRSITPIEYFKVKYRDKDYLKHFIRISNSNLRRNRAGNTENLTKMTFDTIESDSQIVIHKKQKLYKNYDIFNESKKSLDKN